MVWPFCTRWTPISDGSSPNAVNVRYMMTPDERPSASLSGTMRVFFLDLALESIVKDFEPDRGQISHAYHSFINILASSITFAGAGQTMSPASSRRGSTSQ